MNDKKKRGIFCVETIWYEIDDQTSMRPILEVLRDGFLEAPFVHRTAVTKDEFSYCLDEWFSLDEKEFPILYLGYHGQQGSIDLGGKGFVDENEFNFHDIGARIQYFGMGKNRLVHFASCSTLDVLDEEISLFLNETNLSAVSGYSHEVDWFDAAAFDMVYLKELQLGGAISLTPTVIRGIRDGNNSRWGLLEKSSQFGESPYYDLAQHLGFRLEVTQSY